MPGEQPTQQNPDLGGKSASGKSCLALIRRGQVSNGLGGLGRRRVGEGFSREKKSVLDSKDTVTVPGTRHQITASDFSQVFPWSLVEGKNCRAGSCPSTSQSSSQHEEGTCQPGLSVLRYQTMSKSVRSTPYAGGTPDSYSIVLILYKILDVCIGHDVHLRTRDTRAQPLRHCPPPSPTTSPWFDVEQREVSTMKDTRGVRNGTESMVVSGVNWVFGCLQKYIYI